MCSAEGGRKCERGADRVRASGEGARGEGRLAATDGNRATDVRAVVGELEWCRAAALGATVAVNVTDVPTFCGLRWQRPAVVVVVVGPATMAGYTCVHVPATRIDQRCLSTSIGEPSTRRNPSA